MDFDTAEPMTTVYPTQPCGQRHRLFGFHLHQQLHLLLTLQIMLTCALCLSAQLGPFRKSELISVMRKLAQHVSRTGVGAVTPHVIICYASSETAITYMLVQVRVYQHK